MQISKQTFVITGAGSGLVNCASLASMSHRIDIRLAL